MRYDAAVHDASRPPTPPDADGADGAAGRLEPQVARLAEAGALRGDLLEVGCGDGEVALALAEAGLAVTGVDPDPGAVARARGQAAARGLEVAFQVADPLDLGALRRRFDTALDHGLFHALPEGDRRRYAESLAEAVGAGGEVHLLCVSDEEPPGPGPRRIAEWDLRSAFRGLFVLTRLGRGRLSPPGLPGGAAAWVVTFTRL